MPAPASPDALAFGARLRALRTARGWTQAQLAVFAGCRKTISLRGKEEGYGLKRAAQNAL